MATTGAMSENNKNLLAVAWHVILNSPDLFKIFFKMARRKKRKKKKKRDYEQILIALDFSQSPRKVSQTSKEILGS